MNRRVARNGHAQRGKARAKQTTEITCLQIRTAEGQTGGVLQQTAFDTIQMRPPHRIRLVGGLNPRQMIGIGILQPKRLMTIGRDANHTVADDADHPHVALAVKRQTIWEDARAKFRYYLLGAERAVALNRELG